MRMKSGEDQESKSVKTGQGERVGYGEKRNVFRLKRKESREVQERRERGRELKIVGNKGERPTTEGKSNIRNNQEVFIH